MQYVPRYLELLRGAGNNKITHYWTLVDQKRVGRLTVDDDEGNGYLHRIIDVRGFIRRQSEWDHGQRLLFELLLAN